MLIVLGAQGMLGKAICRLCREHGYEFEGFTRQNGSILLPGLLSEIRDKKKPTIVINCAGEPNESSLVNSLGPQFVARIFKDSRVLHISTDCVYDEHRTHVHRVDTIPMPQSEYGVSKYLGEVGLPNVVNIRTSFIGWEHGLLHWLMNQPVRATIEGYSEAWWSGSTVDAVAARLLEIRYGRQLNNIENLASEAAINKFVLLNMYAGVYRPDLTINKNETRYINRVMQPSIVLPQFKDVYLKMHGAPENRLERVVFS